MTSAIKLLVFIVVIAIQHVPAQDSELNFPEDYLGIYKGRLNINSTGGIQDIPMEFHLTEGDSTDHYRYTLIYGEGDTRQERKYSLIAEDKDKGEFIVDENNGIILDDKQIDNRLYCLFEVNGSLLTTFITFGEDHLLWEIVFAAKSEARTTYAENDEKIEVISYPISTVQRAILKKQ